MLYREESGQNLQYLLYITGFWTVAKNVIPTTYLYLSRVRKDVDMK